MLREIIDRVRSSSGSSASRPGTPTSVLLSDVEIIGSIKVLQDLTLEGHLEGEIFSAGEFTLGEGGSVRGGIKTFAAVILGRVEGNIDARGRCALMSTAEVYGDITTSKLVIEDGATFLGESGVHNHQTGLVRPPRPVVPPQASMEEPVVQAAEAFAEAEPVPSQEVAFQGFLLLPEPEPCDAVLPVDDVSPIDHAPQLDVAPPIPSAHPFGKAAARIACAPRPNRQTIRLAMARGLRDKVIADSFGVARVSIRRRRHLEKGHATTNRRPGHSSEWTHLAVFAEASGSSAY